MSQHHFQETIENSKNKASTCIKDIILKIKAAN